LCSFALSLSASRSGFSASDSSISGSLTTYLSLAQLPRSSSLHGSLQKGKSGAVSESVGFRQMGQRHFIRKEYRGIGATLISGGEFSPKTAGVRCHRLKARGQTAASKAAEHGSGGRTLQPEASMGNRLFASFAGGGVLRAENCTTRPIRSYCFDCVTSIVARVPGGGNWAASVTSAKPVM
jgi:hypothetical protein